VAAGAGAAVLAFGLASPDALIAQHNVRLFERSDIERIDLVYLMQLSADAVPALDRLPEPQRSCALEDIAQNLADDAGAPWYATSLGEWRARELLDARPATPDRRVCAGLGAYQGR
jgi:hypothetical protein